MKPGPEREEFTLLDYVVLACLMTIALVVTLSVFQLILELARQGG